MMRAFLPPNGAVVVSLIDGTDKSMADILGRDLVVVLEGVVNFSCG